MVRFDPAWFPRWNELGRAERLFLRTCCYVPPRPARVPAPTDILDTNVFRDALERAFGRDLERAVAGRTVLDLGCGEGGHALALGTMGARVVGADLQRRFDAAAAVARERDLPVRFVHGSTAALRDGAFDRVLSHDAFEHFSEPAAVLAEMARLTRPGGEVRIKFGPPWKNPWGRHMGGTVRRDRPWVHLFVPERVVMRAHSAYHGKPRLLERYAELPGGLNRMTVGRFRRLLDAEPRLTVRRFEVLPIRRLRPIARLPFLREFAAGGVRAECVRR